MTYFLISILGRIKISCFYFNFQGTATLVCLTWSRPLEMGGERAQRHTSKSMERHFSSASFIFPFCVCFVGDGREMYFGKIPWWGIDPSLLCYVGYIVCPLWTFILCWTFWFGRGILFLSSLASVGRCPIWKWNPINHILEFRKMRINVNMHMILLVEVGN